MGVTTPNLEAQIELLSGVYARVDPTTVQVLWEAHGTGTAIGDPIEVQALAEVFNRHGLPRGSVALGSLKRRIGHLHSAAGLAGLAKVVLCLRDGLLRRSRSPRPTRASGSTPALSTCPPGPPPGRRLRCDAPRSAVSGSKEPSRSCGGGGGVGAAAGAVAAAGGGAGVVGRHPRRPPRVNRTVDRAAAHPHPRCRICAPTARLARPRRPVQVAVCGRDGEALAAALRNRLLGDELNAASRDTSPRPVRVRPLAAPVPPPWLLSLNRAEPAVAEIIDRFEAATGRSRPPSPAPCWAFAPVSC